MRFYHSETPNVGFRPTSPPRPALPSAPSLNDSNTKRAKVLHDYDASDRTELSLLADEVCNFFLLQYIF